MSSTGEIGLKSRRPSTPGANQQIVFNQGGVDGANANLTFDYATSNLRVTGNIASTANLSAGNLSLTQNASAGNLSITTLANIGTGNVSNFGVSQNGTVGILGAANINFNNTATVTWVVTPNGTYQANVSATAAGGPGGGGGGAAYTNGALVLGMSNANINFNNSSSVTWTVVANGSTQVNVTATSAGGAAPGNTTEVVFNNGGAFTGDADFTFNVQTNLMSVNGNVRISNSSNLLFGGGQSNTAANSHFAVTYNVTASSLDFIWLG